MSNSNKMKRFTFAGNYLLFQNHLPGVNIIVTNDVIVSKFNAVFCLSFVYYFPGPSGVLYVQIVDSNTGDMRAVFSDRNYSEVWRKSNVTITTSSDFVVSKIQLIPISFIIFEITKASGDQHTW